MSPRDNPTPDTPLLTEILELLKAAGNAETDADYVTTAKQLSLRLKENSQQIFSKDLTEVVTLNKAARSLKVTRRNAFRLRKDYHEALLSAVAIKYPDSKVVVRTLLKHNKDESYFALYMLASIDVEFSNNLHMILTAAFDRKTQAHLTRELNIEEYRGVRFLDLLMMVEHVSRLYRINKQPTFKIRSFASFWDQYGHTLPWATLRKSQRLHYIARVGGDSFIKIWETYGAQLSFEDLRGNRESGSLFLAILEGLSVCSQDYRSDYLAIVMTLLNKPGNQWEASDFLAPQRTTVNENVNGLFYLCLAASFGSLEPLIHVIDRFGAAITLSDFLREQKVNEHIGKTAAAFQSLNIGATVVGKRKEQGGYTATQLSTGFIEFFNRFVATRSEFENDFEKNPNLWRAAAAIAHMGKVYSEENGMTEPLTRLWEKMKDTLSASDITIPNQEKNTTLLKVLLEYPTKQTGAIFVSLWDKHKDAIPDTFYTSTGSHDAFPAAVLNAIKSGRIPARVLKELFDRHPVLFKSFLVMETENPELRAIYEKIKIRNEFMRYLGDKDPVSDFEVVKQTVIDVGATYPGSLFEGAKWFAEGGNMACALELYAMVSSNSSHYQSSMILLAEHEFAQAVQVDMSDERRIVHLGRALNHALKIPNDTQRTQQLRPIAHAYILGRNFLLEEASTLNIDAELSEMSEGVSVAWCLERFDSHKKKIKLKAENEKLREQCESQDQEYQDLMEERNLLLHKYTALVADKADITADLDPPVSTSELKRTAPVLKGA